MIVIVNRGRIVRPYFCARIEILRGKMIKRLIIIGLFTGVAQLFSLFSLKYTSAHSSPEELAPLAQTDSLFQLVLSLIAMGLQSGAMRDIALETNWQEYFKKVQKARSTISTLLFPIGFLGIYNPAYYIFFLSPILAASGDYMLYATSRPVMGSIIASFRTILPYLAVLLSLSIQSSSSYWYLVGTLFAYIITNWYIARENKMSVFYRPAISSLRLYINTIPLGIVNLCLYTIGLGLLIFLPSIYPDTTIATVFVGLKFYLLVKGVLRLIHQSFIREMQSDETCVRADQLSMLITVTVAAAFQLFPDSTISFLFGSKFIEHRWFFSMIGIAGVFYAFNLSTTTRALLDRKDRQYTFFTAMAAIATIISAVVFSFFSESPISVGLAVMIGELVFCFGMVWMTKESSGWIARLNFLIVLLLGLCPLFLIRLYIKDSLPFNMISLATYLLVIVLFNRNRFVTARI